jgi:hypothetical protein
MPKNYAKRLAELIAQDPDIATNYAIQLNDVAFAQQVARELEDLGIPANVNDITGMLTVRLPDDHPTARSRKSLFGLDLHWPRRPEDRHTNWKPEPPLSTA